MNINDITNDKHNEINIDNKLNDNDTKMNIKKIN